MITALLLATLAVIARMVSSTYHLWNLAPVGAIALYAGSRLPKSHAWLIPVVAMVITDVLLDGNRSRPWLELPRLAIYATYAVTTIIGSTARSPRGLYWLPVLSLAASTLFFIVSNLATWAEGLLYPLSLTGLTACYVAGIPFFGRTIVADLVGTAVLFGLGSVIERSFARAPIAANPETAD